MGRQKNNAKISLILLASERPCFSDQIRQIAKTFNRRQLNWEAIGLFDPRDQKSVSKLKLPPKVRMLSYPIFRFGRGFAFCYGFNQSAGERVFFWETNLEISPHSLLLYLDLMDLLNADIVLGSKRHSLSSVHYPFSRRFYSFIYQLLVKILFGLKVSDTHVGLKLYQRRVLERVIPKIVVKNWAFDLEILVIAYSLGFTRLVEAPIEIKKQFSGQEVTSAKILNLLRETLAIFYRQNITGYYRQRFV